MISSQNTGGGPWRGGGRVSEQKADKRGYLHEDFRVFRLRDSRAQQVDYHYHEFDKIILVLGGKVTYTVEGVTYFLKPWDLLLVQHDLIHRPVFDPAQPYERVVIWLGSDWLRRRSNPETQLDTCFELTRSRSFHLLRADGERRLTYMGMIQNLEEALRSDEFGHTLLADLLCQQLLIALNRDVLKDRTAQEQTDSYRTDPKMEEVLRYIAGHLTEELDVDALAGHFYLSRYYLMHRFKAVTGCSLHAISAEGPFERGALIAPAAGDEAARSGFSGVFPFSRVSDTFRSSPEFQSGQLQRGEFPPRTDHRLISRA